MAETLSQPPARRSLDALALFLDFDGTLVELAATPDGITVPDGLASALEKLADSMDGRLALVSGRFLDDITRHVGPVAVFRSGSHGTEIVGPDGNSLAAPGAALSTDVTRSAEQLASELPGLDLEAKPFGLGLHYRTAPHLHDQVAAFADQMSQEHGIAQKRGKLIIELLGAPADKGQAVAALLRQPAFDGCLPVFVGDDVTDEDGFCAVAKAGGFGIVVGDRRETAARYRLADVAEVHAWLEL